MKLDVATALPLLTAVSALKCNTGYAYYRADGSVIEEAKSELTTQDETIFKACIRMKDSCDTGTLKARCEKYAGAVRLESYMGSTLACSGYNAAPNLDCSEKELGVFPAKVAVKTFKCNVGQVVQRITGAAWPDIKDAIKVQESTAGAYCALAVAPCSSPVAKDLCGRVPGSQKLYTYLGPQNGTTCAQMRDAYLKKTPDAEFQCSDKELGFTPDFQSVNAESSDAVSSTASLWTILLSVIAPLLF